MIAINQGDLIYDSGDGEIIYIVGDIGQSRTDYDVIVWNSSSSLNACCRFTTYHLSDVNRKHRLTHIIEAENDE